MSLNTALNNMYPSVQKALGFKFLNYARNLISKKGDMLMNDNDYKVIHPFGSVEIQEEDGSWRAAEIHQHRRNGSVVLYFGRQEYEGLDGSYQLDASEKLLDGDGDEIMWRECKASTSALSVATQEKTEQAIEKAGIDLKEDPQLEGIPPEEVAPKEGAGAGGGSNKRKASEAFAAPAPTAAFAPVPGGTFTEDGKGHTSRSYRPYTGALITQATERELNLHFPSGQQVQIGCMIMGEQFRFSGSEAMSDAIGRKIVDIQYHVYRDGRPQCVQPVIGDKLGLVFFLSGDDILYGIKEGEGGPPSQIIECVPGPAYGEIYVPIVHGYGQVAYS